MLVLTRRHGESVRIGQDIRVSRLIGDAGRSYEHPLRSTAHGAYVFVLEHPFFSVTAADGTFTIAGGREG